MSHDSPRRVAILGDGDAAAAYAALPPMPGVALFRATQEDALSDPDVSGVIVATSPADRSGSVLAALAEGKPVLVDAPFAGSISEAEQVRAAAEAAQVPVTTARPWRRHDVFQSFRATIDSGELGTPSFFQWINEEATVGLDEANPAAAASAGLDLALWLLGDTPEHVFARRTGLGGVTISLRFRNGATALIERRGVAPANAVGPGFAWLLGPRGEVRWDQRTGGVAVLGDASAAPMIGSGCLVAEVAAAVTGWRDGPNATPDPAELALVATLAAVNASIQQGQPVTVGIGETENGGGQ